MATLDRRENDEEFNVEIFLKLWHWETNTWALNTRIDYPHGPHTVIAMSFCPSNAQGDLFMTAGSDGTVRTWSIRTVKSKDGRIEGKVKTPKSIPGVVLNLASFHSFLDEPFDNELPLRDTFRYDVVS